MNVANFFKDAGDPASEMVGELLHPMGVEGLYARSGAYELVIDALHGLISRIRDPKAEAFRFPPVMSRKQLEKSGYLGSFPNLLGCVCALHGTEKEVRTAVECFDDGGDWTKALSAADLVLSPAACYPVYPIAAQRGPVPDDGLLFDVASDCFRREPSKDLDRLQSFRMREFVCIGSPAQTQSFRDQWMDRALVVAEGLGLECKIAPANDPFFGRGGQLMATSQLQQSLKFELLIPIYSASRPTACMSFNCHRDHFGDVWELAMTDSSTAHTACVAFGMDRLAVALFHTHGIELENWPSPVRDTLNL
ncbi:MAG: amino acid--[acyl-carrier-protein] ligase [Rhodoblastus sp.]|uniref:amino acid--[acyl-carrier-protein] ligase n=1 Tax=Rhodoblastus sp. TaxID=1962975 RepID=UPI003F9C6451